MTGCDHKLRSKRLVVVRGKQAVRVFCLYCGTDMTLLEKGEARTWKDQDEVGKLLAAQRQAEEDARNRAETERRERMANTTPREFHYTRGTSNKFWRVWRAGTQHVVQFGRIGTAGQRRSKDHGSVREANSAISRLIRQKENKGYYEIEIDDGPGSYEIDVDDSQEEEYERMRRSATAKKAWETRRANAKKAKAKKEPSGFLKPRRVPKVN